MYKPVTALYVGVGPEDHTNVAIVIQDSLVEVIILDPDTKYDNIIDVVINIMGKYNMTYQHLQSPSAPYFMHRMYEECTKRDMVIKKPGIIK